ncbi:hypothetical protein FRB94_010036 [Tulasnella sp. JGI-2019a]|nr:hypothetical protein FRB94_010036 [Tulasnella sp. JGI-2019a]
MSAHSESEEEQLPESDIKTGKLSDPEQRWADQYEFLYSAGYQLRPRYRPGWKMSWNFGEYPDGEEDGIQPNFIQLHHLLDATRMRDGVCVNMKRVKVDTNEIKISRFLWSEELRNDPRNHSVPLLDVLYDPADVEHAIIVMPLLRKVDDPYLISVREVMEVMEQTLEGLVFMHEHKIAHRDCAFGNVMMDARAMFPRGWHPQQYAFLPNGRSVLPTEKASRTAAGGVRYYFIDFGISTQDADSVTGIYCQEPCPELSSTVPYNPYKLDIFIIGMSYKKSLLDENGRLEFLRPLVESMTKEAPDERPSATEALSQLREIKAKMSGRRLSQRLTPLEPESIWDRRIKDFRYQIAEWWWYVKPHRKLRPFA